MGQQDEFDHILLSLYEAALGDAQWRATSALIDDACQIVGSHLCILDQGRMLFEQFWSHGESWQEQRDDYVNNYFWRDERVPRVLHMPDSRVVLAHETYTEAERNTSATYNELLVRNRAQNGLQIRMDGPDGPDGLDIVWVTGDPTASNGWSSSQVQMMVRLLPHVRQFVRVRHALIRADGRGAALTALLDNNMVGVIYLGRRGVILETNARAREILRRGEGLSDRDGVLSGTVAADDVWLGKLLADALPGRGRQPSSGSMTVERSLLLPRLVVHVNPLPARALDFGARNAVALVLLVDPGARAAIDAELVAATFRAESSVRWLIKQIHAKLGISRQADLVRLVLSAHHVPKRGP